MASGNPNWAPVTCREIIDAERDWALLLPELLELIAKKILSVSDYVRVRAVCSHWRANLSPRPGHIATCVPWLILPRSPIDGRHVNLGSSLSMYPLSQSRTHILDLPAIQGKRICGSSHGWLVLEKERKVSLLNPFTRDEINLPSLSSQLKPFSRNSGDAVLLCSRKFCIKKAMLSSNPNMGLGCVVMALFRGTRETALCTIQDECWSLVTTLNYAGPAWDIEDISQSNGQFYLIRCNGHVTICDPRKSTLTHVAASFNKNPDHGLIFRAVECANSGNDVMIFCSSLRPERSGLVMLSAVQKTWLPVERQDSNYVFFLGGNFHCIAIPAEALALDGWERDTKCFTCLEYERMIGDDIPGLSCTIKRCGIDGGNVTLLAGHLGLFDRRKRFRYNCRASFLWFTPTGL